MELMKRAEWTAATQLNYYNNFWTQLGFQHMHLTATASIRYQKRNQVPSYQLLAT